MKKVNIIILFVIVVLMFSISFSHSMMMCSCATPPLRVAVERSDVIFFGRVIKFEVSFKEERRIATIEVSKIWKGKLNKLQEVRTNFGPSDCGFDFMVGSNYLVYGYSPDSNVYTYDCTRTEVSFKAAQDIDSLNIFFPNK